MHPDPTNDYVRLYRALGLEPDCSLDDFTRAYRRHVSDLHPDRERAARTRGQSDLPLPDLIALYDQAMRFHRRYGRLPGTSPATQPALQPDPTASVDAHDALPAVMVDNDAAAGDAGRHRLAWLIVAALVLMVVLVWQSPNRPVTAPGVQIRIEPAPPADDATPSMLVRGMDPATVRAVQGEPVRRRGNEWEYGPSWLRFEKGHLVDWYSSPLYRLKTATPSPPPQPPTAETDE